MINLLIISLAPVCIIGTYIWIRDKYEKEPLSMLGLALLIGAFITLPVILMERRLLLYGEARSLGPVWNAFLVAGGVEEGFKYFAFFLIIWRNKNFNEKLDGIVYAVFIALGFAGVENILYVARGGIQVALTRAITAVPAHALFGIIMGYHFGLAKFLPEKRRFQLLQALIWPVLGHGFYDFCLMSGNAFLLSLFVPYVIWLWYNGNRRMQQLSDLSSFKTDTTSDP